MSGATKITDLVVVGSVLGLKVVVVEKNRQIGGTSAWSGGWMWIPRNPLAIEAGLVEPIDAPRAYLRHELGNAYDESLAAMFLDQGPRMVDFFRRRLGFDFILGAKIPDFHDSTPGAGLGGRSVCAAPFDGRALGARIHDLKAPLAEISPFGMGVGSGADLQNFLDATRRFSAFRHVAARLARHWRDLLRHGRGLHLVGGNALVARLLKSADDLGVEIIAGVGAREPLRDGGRVAGVRLADGRDIIARRGVVLASGGFPHDLARKAALFAHAPTGAEHFSAAPESNTGDGLRIGEKAGGVVREDLAHAGAWAPVSLVPRRDGGVGRFPHLIERGKPGLIMVRRDGQRFCNEADSYHDVMQALFRACPPGGPVEAWMICDHAFQRRYGLGRARPRPFPLSPWLRNGYLKRGRTISELAKACAIDPRGLDATVARLNADAAQGRDSAFGRGESAYNRAQGEPGHAPNPCVAAIEAAPFYAVKIAPGSLGTFAGLKTDAYARALGADGQPIAGLYAVGADMASMMGGYYPAGGITLGPAMTFAYVASHHASGVPLDTPNP